MATESSTITSTPETAVRRYFAALNTGDVESIRRLFTDGAVLMVPGFPTATGSREVAAMFEGAFTAMRLAMNPTIDHVDVQGHLAVLRSHASGTMTLLAEGAEIPQENRDLWVLRTTDGGWRIAAYMFNSAAASAAG